jgi:hypothetical protein
MKSKLISLVILVVLASGCIVAATYASRHNLNQDGITPATGPLTISSANPRYFNDGSGRPIYLTGLHGGSELQDYAWGEVLNYPVFLDLLVSHNLNFMRMWVVETTRLTDQQNPLTIPMPYERVGPGSALDSEPKFDLRRFDPAYFDRLRSRVVAARDRGIYVMVMLFQGFSIESKGSPKRNPWSGHPYHSANNVNGINGDADGNGEGEEVHTLKIPAVTRLQETYLRKVVDTLNDLDNVLYEIANESHNQSTAWQYHMIGYIRDYEKSKPKRHPIVMTVQHPNGDNTVLFKSPAVAISPNKVGGYGENPPAADGAKIIINDTDHVATKTANHRWVWKSFLRGLNPILLWNPEKAEIPKWELTRRNLGYTRRYAQRINLATMVPRDDLASSGYCLAQPGVAYLAYLPNGGMASVDLRGVKGVMRVEWFSPSTGELVDGGTVAGGATEEFSSPFTRSLARRGIDRVLRTFKIERPVPSSDAVLYLTVEGATTQP